ncbi:MAG: Electron transfer flavoprotein-ubiquinone oxidoreductase [Alphaproteobacteria bacterium]|nr:Electron transfer flavoprotein-ubiquinone oxidoreductase [Alphaproteobacteria bacterium]
MDPIHPDRTIMPYDVVIVGAGPAGLSCAIRLKQLQPSLSICVLEKGAEVGAHLMSGAVLEPRALAELLPNWKELGAPLKTPVTEDRFCFLTKTKSWRLPTPKQMHNKGNYIISLGEFGKFLAGQAETLGVEIFAGFPAGEILYDAQNNVIGVATNDMGLNKDGTPGDQFMPGVEIHARQVILAEGCRGSLTKTLQEKFDLRKDCDPQTYGLGVKEIWEIPAGQHKKGLAVHTIGWPMNHQTYGGSWLYHYGENLVSLGYVVGLDYENPSLSPFQEMQRWKTHPEIAKHLANGKRISYGARTIVEGGFQSIPKLVVNGAMIIGDSGGFLNVPKIKGNHLAMKSGMVAAEALVEHLQDNRTGACDAYPEKLRASWLWEELKTVRNIRPGFHHGLFLGLINAALETYIFRGKAPWTLKNHADHSATKPKAQSTPIQYPKPDGVLSFDRLSSVYLSNTNHAEHQPGHLKLHDPAKAIEINYKVYGSPEQFYCPAGVYEIVHDAPDGGPRLQINAQNCVHCKACDIKDPTQNIDWTTPEGGGGPRYMGM